MKSTQAQSNQKKQETLAQIKEIRSIIKKSQAAKMRAKALKMTEADKIRKKKLSGNESTTGVKQTIFDFIKANKRRPNHRSKEPVERVLGRASMEFKEYQLASYDEKFHDEENALCEGLGIKTGMQWAGILLKCRQVKKFIKENGRLPKCKIKKEKEYRVYLMMDSALLRNSDGSFYRSSDAQKMTAVLNEFAMPMPTKSRAQILDDLAIEFLKKKMRGPHLHQNVGELVLTKHISHRGIEGSRDYDLDFVLRYTKARFEYCK